MASIRLEMTLRANPAQVWDAVRDVGAIHTRLAPNFVTDVTMNGHARNVTFANGMMAGRFIVAALASLLYVLPASAQPYPSKPVHLIVAYSPGGTGDVVARIIADKLTPALGQTVVVENRPGATGAIGTTAVLQAPPDGYTLLVGQTGEVVVNQYWMKSLTYEPNDLMPVALATVVPLALAVPGKAPYASMIASTPKRARDRRADHPAGSIT